MTKPIGSINELIPFRGMRRNVTLVIVAGCIIGLVTFGVRASFGLFTDPLT